MADLKTAINWERFLEAELPAVVDRLTAARVALVAEGPESTDRIHSHPRPELCLVLKGRIRVITGDEPLVLRAGSLLLLAPRMYHDWAAVGGTAETLWLGASTNHMGGALAQMNLQGQQTVLGGLDFLDFEAAHPIFLRLVEETRGKDKSWLRIVKAQLQCLLAYARRQLGSGGQRLRPEAEQSAAEIIAYNARTYLDQHFAAPVTLAQVAHHVALSPNYLAGLFKKQFGRTIIGYQTELRIAEAKRLLTETDRKVASIAAAVGYRSPYYFSRAFSKEVGRSPAAYRARARKR